jgi:hypothetical protein
MLELIWCIGGDWVARVHVTSTSKEPQMVSLLSYAFVEGDENEIKIANHDEHEGEMLVEGQMSSLGSHPFHIYYKSSSEDTTGRGWQ